MDEKKLKKIVRKTILENFGSSSYPLNSVVFKKDEYETPGDYYDDYFKAMVIEMNRTEFKNLELHMEFPKEFTDSEGAVYKLNSVESTKIEYRGTKVYTRYTTNIDNIEFFVTLSFNVDTNIYETGKIEVDISGATYEDKDYDSRLRKYMNGEEN